MSPAAVPPVVISALVAAMLDVCAYLHMKKFCSRQFVHPYIWKIVRSIALRTEESTEGC